MADTTLVGEGLPPGWTIGTQIYESDETGSRGNTWNGTGYVPLDEDAWADYATPTPETSPGTYTCQFPLSSPPGWYAWIAYKQTGDTPSPSDSSTFAFRSAAAYWWDGTTFGASPQTNDGESVVAANQILSQAQGTDRTFTFTLRDANGTVITSYLGTETLSCSIWSGQDQEVLASPVTTWLDPASGTINVTVAAADLDDVVPSLYRMSGKLVSGSTAILFFDGSLNVTPSPGAASTPSTYCSFNDVLLYAPQISNLQDAQVDTAGMLGSRARAQTWTNERCLDGYRPNFGRARRAVSADGTTAGPHLRWVTAGPDGATTPTIEDLRGAIALGGLRVTDLIREANAHMAAAICYLNQPGRDNPYHQQGAYHQAKAADLLGQSVIEIDLDDPLNGVYEVRIGQDVTWLL